MVNGIVLEHPDSDNYGDANNNQRDEPAQVKRADTLLRGFTQEMPGFISLVALAELSWVLRSYYRCRESSTHCLP